MKSLVTIVILATLGIILLLPLSVNASTAVNITITATGSEIDISCNQTAWDAGTLSASETAETVINWGRLTSAGSESVDVTIGGYSMKNPGETVTWTLANDGNPGAATIGMKVGLDDGDDTFDITIKNVGETLDKLVDELATGNQDFGLKFWAPTSSLGNEVMEMVGAAGHVDDNPRGLILTGSID